jgi:hypothetical protein
MAIAMAELPPGWTYSFRKSLSGRCYATPGTQIRSDHASADF